MTQLRDLAKPFAPRLIKQPPKGKFGTYVAHDVVNQKLLAVLGPFDFEVTELVLGAEGRVEGCLARLTCEIDGRRTTVVEIGDCERPENWSTQGARMKDAASDAFKRCAMRVGCGLHLWGQADFFLFDVLDAAAPPQLPYAAYAADDPERPFEDVKTGSLL
jgi:hypothetical protein